MSKASQQNSAESGSVFAMSGISKRMVRLFGSTESRAVVVPIDDSLTQGAVGGLMDLRSLTASVARGHPDAVLAYPAQLRRHWASLAGMNWIVHMNGSTDLAMPTRKRLLGSVPAAVAAGADAVALHINFSSRFESEMLHDAGVTVERAHALGFPVLVIAYPRRENDAGAPDNYTLLRRDDPDAYASLVSHAVRSAVEIGADVVKTQYTGDPTTFATVVASADGVPLLVAGGGLAQPLDVLALAAGAVEAGAAGVSFGRNVFLRAAPDAMIRALRAVVHEGASPEDAISNHQP